MFGPFPSFLMNGKAQPDAMNLKAGTRYRFRLFNLAGDTPLQVSINAGDDADPVARRREGRLSAAAVAGHDEAGDAAVRSGRDLRFRAHAVCAG